MFIFSAVILIILSSFSVVSYLAISPTTSPLAYFSNKWHALSIAINVLFGSNPFSNLLLASLLNIAFDVLLTFTLSNIADSIIMFLVLSVISVSNPPITPAKPIVFSPSEITISSVFKSLSIPSSVVNFSPSFAILTSKQSFRQSAS